jgi:hypothetical protein
MIFSFLQMKYNRHFKNKMSVIFKRCLLVLTIWCYFCGVSLMSYYDNKSFKTLSIEEIINTCGYSGALHGYVIMFTIFNAIFMPLSILSRYYLSFGDRNDPESDYSSDAQSDNYFLLVIFCNIPYIIFLIIGIVLYNYSECIVQFHDNLLYKLILCYTIISFINSLELIYFFIIFILSIFSGMFEFIIYGSFTNPIKFFNKFNLYFYELILNISFCGDNTPVTVTDIENAPNTINIENATVTDIENISGIELAIPSSI